MSNRIFHESCLTSCKISYDVDTVFYFDIHGIEYHHDSERTDAAQGIHPD